VDLHNRSSEFVEKYWPKESDLPKHQRLRQAITSSIIDGYWSTGARLPTESEFVSVTPCSLGTVQRALRDLASDGVIERRRGSGTIVADLNRAIAEPWHMRFFADKNSPEPYLPVFTTVIERVVMGERGPWSDEINQGDANIVRIDRIFSINDELKVYAVFYALADRFPELIDLPKEALNGTNFKVFIRQHYRVPVHKVKQATRFEVPSAEIVQESDCLHGQAALVLNVIAYTLDNVPMYYQDFYIPPNDFRLDLGTAPRE